MLSNREGQSAFLDVLVEALADQESTSVAKIASCHPIEKAATETAKLTQNADSVEKSAAEKMTLHQVRVARRQGRFVKVAGRSDLYQDAATNDFWKISEDKQYAVRSFQEDNGLVVSE